MILSAVHICYDPSHKPFASEGAVKIEDLDSERPASKIIRAVIRYNGIDATDWESYSLHRCYRNSHTKTEDQHPEAFKSESNLAELEIRDEDSVFIRKIDDRLDEMEEEQRSNSRRSSRKRKKRADERADSTSRERKSTSHSSNDPATVDEVSSDLQNLSSSAAQVARTISKLLGGDDWKTQPIGKLVPIQTRGDKQLQSLVRLVKTSLEIPQLSKPERSGLFSSDLVEALTRAYHQRVSSSMAKQGQSSFFDLRPLDYAQANELLKGKIEQDGSWERSSIRHIDQSTLSKPASRFPLNDTGLSGSFLNAAQAVCVLWNNKKWINQAPLPGLSPISLKDSGANAILRQIAQLSKVKPGEMTPDGFPSIVLEALRESIKKNEEAFDSNRGKSQAGWSQRRCVKDTLALLKKRVARSVGSASSSTAAGSSKAARGDEGENKASRAKRRKIAS